MNRLQLHLRARFARLSFLVGFLALLISALMVTPAHAVNELWNPDGAPIFRPVEDGGCDGTNCSTTKFVMFRAFLWAGSSFDTHAYSCAWAVKAGQTVVRLSHHTAHDSAANYLQNADSVAFATGLRCWDGNDWTTSFQVGTNFPLNGADDTVVATDSGNAAVRLFNGNVNAEHSGEHNYSTQYASLGNVVSGQVIYWAGQSAYSFLKVVSNGPFVTGSPIQFLVQWRTAFDVWWTEFWKSSSLPQFHNSLGGNDFNLTQTGSFTFTVTYATSGSYVPVVALGNTFCSSASSTGVLLRGSGCAYNLLSLTGAIRVFTPSEMLNAGSGASTGWTWIEGNVFSGGKIIPRGSGSIFTPAGQSKLNPWQWIGGGNTGSLYYGQGATASGVVGVLAGQGIFGIGSLMSFQGYGPTGNFWLDLAQDLLLIVVFAALWVAGKLFSLLQLSAFFSFVVSILHPVSGSVHTVPMKLFGIDVPAGIAGTSFTISYVKNEGGAQVVYKLVQLSVIISTIAWVSRHLLFHRKK